MSVVPARKTKSEARLGRIKSVTLLILDAYKSLHLRAHASRSLDDGIGAGACRKRVQPALPLLASDILLGHCVHTCAVSRRHLAVDS